MARILCISSHVARGAIGLSAALPVLQALGHDVIALPTILLSNHPGHALFAGERVAPDLLRRMLAALDANGWLGDIDAVFTGYLPSAAHVDFAVDAVTLARSRRAGVIHFCDPVLGDLPKGVYIEPAAAEALRERLVPIADALKMNRFECEWLTGATLADSRDVAVVARQRGWRELIVTSLPDASGDADGVQRGVGNALVVDGEAPITCRVRWLRHAPNGTGDVLAALYLGRRMREGAAREDAFRQAVTDVATILSASAGHDELQLIGCLGEIAR